MSSKTPVSKSDFVVKLIATGICTCAIDHFVFSESNFNTSAILVTFLAVGAYLGMLIGSTISDLSHSLPVVVVNGKRFNRKSG